MTPSEDKGEPVSELESQRINTGVKHQCRDIATGWSPKEPLDEELERFVRRNCVPTHAPDCPKEVLPEAGGVCTCGFEQPAEAVDHPAHYNMGDIEVIDVIEDWRLGFHEGNAVKYIGRAKFKGKELEDLKKALWYLKRRVDQLECGDE